MYRADSEEYIARASTSLRKSISRGDIDDAIASLRSQEPEVVTNVLECCAVKGELTELAKHLKICNAGHMKKRALIETIYERLRLRIPSSQRPDTGAVQRPGVGESQAAPNIQCPGAMILFACPVASVHAHVHVRDVVELRQAMHEIARRAVNCEEFSCEAPRTARCLPRIRRQLLPANASHHVAFSPLRRYEVNGCAVQVPLADHAMDCELKVRGVGDWRVAPE